MVRQEGHSPAAVAADRDEVDTPVIFSISSRVSSASSRTRDMS
ncbi:hypothetical protein ACFQ2B_01515 [Streptomyces stramineus]